MIALAVAGLLTAFGILAVVVWMGNRFDLDEDPDPWVSADDIPTEPWPAPR